MIRPAIPAVAATFLVCSALPALAHYPFCTCEARDGTVTCQGGFSDGTSAEGVKLDVISYDEDVLVPGVFDASSTISFPRPEGEFYVLFDAGPGHIVEVDYNDIQGLAP